MVIDHASGAFFPGDSGERSAAGTPVRRVVVVGGGIAGLRCALACVRAGAQVDQLEARASAAVQPARTDVVPNLLRDLAQLPGLQMRRTFTLPASRFSMRELVTAVGGPRSAVRTCDASGV